jgi:hypothetical protein
MASAPPMPDLFVKDHLDAGVMAWQHEFAWLLPCRRCIQINGPSALVSDLLFRV